MLEIHFYETEDGYLVRRVANVYGYDPFDRYLINNSPLQPTHAPDWFRVQCEKSDPLVILGQESKFNKQIGWVKRDGFPELDALPQELPVDPTTDNSIAEKYDAYADFYTPVTEEVVNPRKIQEHKATRLGYITWANLEAPEKFSFKLAANSGWNEDRNDRILDETAIFAKYSNLGSFIHVDHIQKAMTPSFAWHLGPCTLPSQYFYRLIRSYVKENLDGHYATITSDYDFVFQVQKVLPRKPYEVKYTTLSGKRKVKAKTHVRLEKDSKVSILYITHKKNVHGTEYGSVVVDDICGFNLSDLLEKIRSYLDEIMARINSPLKICDCCDGTGIETDIAK